MEQGAANGGSRVLRARSLRAKEEKAVPLPLAVHSQ